ncbi:MAG: DUF3872 domain-containing protein [Proteiniphilum sp.]|jgi:hypothetical protein|uniref:DUF3872 domain-containing protein n=1 Tax=Proteiniphilum sp. TaxID=1926877 RepID=UPI002B21933D|nr:DUF3872 domain-containing protein [Proteiniphilum sp.]MEA5128311.1 DUF3872 domain-containing protein [Proteiniphilum sp.]
MKKNRKTIIILIGIGLIVLLAVACNADLDVHQAYSFDLVTMPVQKRIMKNETAEIRCELVREGNYLQARYFIRYFQPDGKGELKLDDGTMLEPNELYPLEKQVFRLYYTSNSIDQQVIDIYIQDNFGQIVQKTFSFQNESADGDIE